MRYKYKYIDKVPVESFYEDYFIKGSLAHYLIECYLGGTSRRAALIDGLPLWVSDHTGITLAGMNEKYLVDYTLSYGELLHKTSPIYTGEDKIRNKDNSIPKDPINYPPKDLKDEYYRRDLHQLKQELDIEATLYNSSATALSVANICAEAYYLSLNFELGDWYQETIAVEYDIEEHKLPFKTDNEWRGKIDWIARTVNDSIAIIDHKSGKKCPEPDEVNRIPQLTTYALLYYEITGVMVDYVGIYHLPSANLLVQKFDSDIAVNNWNYLEQIQDAIDNEAFPRHHPTAYNTPCIKRDYKSGVINGRCPYLEHCWPEYVEKD